MFKHVILGLALAVAAPAMPAMAQTYSAAEIAKGLQPMVGSDYGNGVVLSAIQAEENNTLVLVIDATQGWGKLARANTTDIFMNGFCADPEGAAFVKSGWVRVDTLDHGADLLKGTASNTCPAAN